MSPPWKIKQTDNEEWRLNNSSGTFLSFSKRVDFATCESLMRCMTYFKVPFAYSEGLKEVYLTFLNCNRGDYEEGYIRINCEGHTVILGTTLIHELAHHLDSIEKISNRPKIINEFKRVGNLIAPAGGESYNCEEYVTIGFELFYFGKRGSKFHLRKHNNKLYNVISRLDKKYRNI